MGEANGLLALNLLKAKHPRTIAGYRRFRGVIESDQVLPQRIKALFVACAGCTRGYVDMARRELERAAAAGLSQEEAASAVAILSSVRGEGAALRFFELFRAVYPDAPDAWAPEEEISVGQGEAERNFRQYFGEVPPSLAKLVELVPDAADAYYLMREGTLSGTALAARHAELLLVTVLTADYSEWSAVHMDGARRAGATEREVAEAVLCAVPVSGLSAWVVGATAMAN